MRAAVTVLLLSSMFACAGSVPAAPAPAAEGKEMFAKMKALVGVWEGTFQWSEGRTGSGSLRAEYSLTGAGSALVENLILNGAPFMTSIYHLDGPELRMTHYCAAANQPRLKAGRIDLARAAADFEFVDVTNAAPGAGYVEALHLRIVDENGLTLRFRFGGGPGKSGVETIALKRVRAAW